MGSRPETVDAHECAAQLIPWLINGRLDADEAADVRAHLAICPDCRADFDSEQRLYDAVRTDGLLVFSGEPSFQKLIARIEADNFAATESAPVAIGAPPIVGEGSAADTSGPTPPRSGASRETVRDRARPSNRTAPRRRGARPRFWGSPVLVRWVAAAAVIEAVGLGFGALAWQRHNPVDASAYASTSSTLRSNAAPYRTLTTPAAGYASGPRVRVVFGPHLSLDQLQSLLQSVGAHIVDGPTDAHVYTLGFAEPIASVEVLDERLSMLRADPNVLFAEPAEVRPP
ncbi:MAG TPA: zf-HC2 domain-containing protein [Steroidobacteraceae bacterium]